MEDNMKICVFTLVILSCFSGVYSKCELPDAPPTYNWPLGEDINAYEIANGVATGNFNNPSFGTGPNELDYDAVEFQGSIASYVDLPITTVLSFDFTLQFFLYTMVDGVFLHYRTDTSADPKLITDIKMQISTGELVISLHNATDEMQQTASGVTLDNTTWYRISVSRDGSQSGFRIKIGNTQIDMVFDDVIKNVATSSPGKIRVGGSHDGDSFFTGKFTCLQVLPCKNPMFPLLYIDACNTTHWPPISISTVTMPLMTTSVTTPPATTTTMPLMTTPSYTAGLMRASLPATSPTPSCYYYRVKQFNSTFDSNTVVINVFSGDTLRTCSWHCSSVADCGTFIFKTGTCWLATSTALTKPDIGSVMYELV